jgi:hypothetical protein
VRPKRRPRRRLARGRRGLVLPSHIVAASTVVFRGSCSHLRPLQWRDLARPAASAREVGARNRSAMLARKGAALVHKGTVACGDCEGHREGSCGGADVEDSQRSYSGERESLPEQKDARGSGGVSPSFFTVDASFVFRSMNMVHLSSSTLLIVSNEDWISAGCCNCYGYWVS